MHVLAIWAPGSEEIEAIAPVDILIRGGIRVTVAGLEPGPFAGSRGIMLMPGISLDEVLGELYDCVMIPGGYGGMESMRASDSVLGILRRHHEAGRLIASLCASPLVLERAGILEKVSSFTSHPAVKHEFREDLIPRHTGARVEVSQGVVTGNGPGAAIEFGLTVLELLRGPEARRSVEAAL